MDKLSRKYRPPTGRMNKAKKKALAASNAASTTRIEKQEQEREITSPTPASAPVPVQPANVPSKNKMLCHSGFVALYFNLIFTLSVSAPTSTTSKKFSYIQKALNFDESFDSGSISNESSNQDQDGDKGCDVLDRALSLESDICDSGDYLIVHKSFWSSFVENMICKHCQAHKMSVKVTEEHGFVKKIQVTCKVCSEVLANLYTSPRIVDKDSSRPPFALNRKMCEVFINTGTG